MKGLLWVIQIPRGYFECGLRLNDFAEIQTLEFKLLLTAGLVLLTQQYYTRCKIVKLLLRCAKYCLVYSKYLSL